jgi:multisubunit Na+/H+ antiporter MnhB subunit
VILLSALLSLAGFVALCLAMDRHHLALLGARPTSGRRWLLRGLGLLGLAVSAATAIRGWGLTNGIVGWLGLLTLAAAIVLLTLAYRPARSPPRRFAP